MSITCCRLQSSKIHCMFLVLLNADNVRMAVNLCSLAHCVPSFECCLKMPLCEEVVVGLVSAAFSVGVCDSWSTSPQGWSYKPCFSKAEAHQWVILQCWTWLGMESLAEGWPAGHCPRLTSALSTVCTSLQAAFCKMSTPGHRNWNHRL